MYFFKKKSENLQLFMDQINGVARVETAHQIKELLETTSSEDVSAGIKVAPHSAAVSLKAGGKEQEKEVLEKAYRATYKPKIVFSGILETINSILSDLRLDRLYVLMDEWTAITDEDVQPFVAEFLKRSFFASPKVVFKIASLEFRSNFGTTKGNYVLGFELGGDIATAVELDDYFVYDRNPESVTKLFAELLYKHLQSELQDPKVLDPYGVKTAQGLIDKLFSAPKTFHELVRSSEGVPRDLINIFSAAYFDCLRRTKTKIDYPSVISAAQQWFERDKAPNLNDSLQNILKRIMDEVIGKKQARCFLLERSYQKHPTIRKLVDFRIIHILRKGYSDKDNPGVRYNVYSLDYGTYIDLKGTAKQPEFDFPSIETTQDAKQRIVPFDDKRSIRRVILDPGILN